MLDIIRKTCTVMLCLAVTAAAAGPAGAAFEEKEVSARLVGLAGAFTGLADDSTAIYWNPAGLRLIPSVEFCSSYTNLFWMDELGYSVNSVVLPIRRAGTFGLSMSQFGPSDYRESQITFSHSVYLIPGVLFGYSMKSLSLTIADEKSSSFGADLGFIGNVSEKLRLGFMTTNINGPVLGDTTERFSQTIRAGGSFKAVPGLVSLLDLKKVSGKPLQIHAAQEMALNSVFVMRCGVQNNPMRFGGGFGITTGIFKFDYGYLSHPVLSGQHHFSLTARFGKWASEEYVPEYSKKKRGKSSSAKKKEAGPSRKVNINSADAKELSTLPGIGRVSALRIIRHRQEHGVYRSVDELLLVPRFSRNTLNNIRPFIFAGPPGEEGAPVAPEVKEEAPLEEVEEPAPVKRPRVRKEAVKEAAPVPAVPVKAPEPEPVKVKAQPKSVQRVDINRAGLKDLKKAGFSTSQAKNIIRFRARYGDFRSPDDLQDVPGITPKMIEKVKENISVE